VCCRQVRAKRDLVRIVHSPEGSIAADERGKAPGRGAYVCRCRACLLGAIEQRKLDRALKTQLTAEDRQRLSEYGHGWPVELPAATVEQA
jgi:uncharacterized protein